MNNVFELRKKKIFTLQEANDILPLINRITSERVLDDSQESINKWVQKLEKLGAHPKGLQNADFDNGSGFFCWKYPEVEIVAQHPYNGGFRDRTPVE